jgi:hypothetical protein
MTTQELKKAIPFTFVNRTAFNTFASIRAGI